MLTWSQDSFAYADSFDEVAGRYRGLRCAQMLNITQDNLTGLLVRPEVALTQQQAETASGADPETTKPLGPDDETPPLPPPTEAVSWQPLYAKPGVWAVPLSPSERDRADQPSVHAGGQTPR